MSSSARVPVSSPWLAAALLAFGGLAMGCSSSEEPPPPAASSAPASLTAAPTPSAAPAALPLFHGPHEGQTLARSARGDALYVADEDTGGLAIVALPLDAARPPRTVKLPGRPAQVLVQGDRVLVTVRDPGLLLVLRPDETAGLVESARVELAADAFGLATTPDGKTALVTSAWTHTVSAVELATGHLSWSLDVGREPRGITVMPDGNRAYVTHLVGAGVTRIDDITGAARATAVRLPVAPLRARSEVPEDATLAYAGVLSPDGARLFVPRQALSAEGKRAWNGQAVVDVLLTADDSALARPGTKAVGYSTKELDEMRAMGTGRGPFRDLTWGGGIPLQRQPFIQPRAAVYRASTRSLLIASEGTDALVELDALAIEPAAHVLRQHPLKGRSFVPRAGLERALVISHTDGVLFELELEDGRLVTGYDTGFLDGASEGLLVGIERRKRGSAEVTIVQRQPDDAFAESHCGAPSGVALSEDERVAWVWCRSTAGVVEVMLDADKEVARKQTILPNGIQVRADPLPAQTAVGRRLFYDASDRAVSEGFACAGCHPDGRDDGHVWQEMTDEEHTHDNPGDERCATYLSTAVRPFFFDMVLDYSLRRGHARQTPMLAGRVAASGPYGWHGKSPDLPSRILRGTAIHGWNLPELACAAGAAKTRALALAAFVRAGLVPPPHQERPLSEQELRGKAVFEDAKSACASCHVPATGYTDRNVVPFAKTPPVFTKAGPPKDGDQEEDRMFKTPSLLGVAGTAPYFHDGSAATLEELIDKNHDRMGKTSHLAAADRAALVAFLRTL